MKYQDIYHTVSGQRDPTAGAALSRIIAEENRKRRSDRRKAQRKYNRQLRQQAQMAKTIISTNSDKEPAKEAAE